MSGAEVFTNKGYLHIPSALAQGVCVALSGALKGIVADGESELDAQCPISPAVYGHPVFDALLEEMLPHIEAILNKKIHPTYSYARLYQTGEELKPHIDREECEISATVTLEFEDEVWPFFIADDLAGTNTVRVDAGQGDVILYQGTQKPHWREKFTGKWQTQVFLHYVDATGPNAGCIYDGRNNLSHKPSTVDDVLYWHFSDAITLAECEQLIKHSQGVGVLPATIGVEHAVDTTYRDAKRCELPTHKGVGAMLVGAALSANTQAWKFDVTHSDQCEILQYDVNGHYDAHIDTFMLPGRPCRKLTVIGILNDGFEGGRFYLKDGRKKVYPPQKKGDILVFPSFLVHGVEKVTTNVRYSVVSWMVGPFFK